MLQPTPMAQDSKGCLGNACPVLSSKHWMRTEKFAQHDIRRAQAGQQPLDCLDQ
jgi:hypothetical protein